MNRHTHGPWKVIERRKNRNLNPVAKNWRTHDEIQRELDDLDAAQEHWLRCDRYIFAVLFAAAAIIFVIGVLLS